LVAEEVHPAQEVVPENLTEEVQALARKRKSQNLLDAYVTETVLPVLCLLRLTRKQAIQHLRVQAVEETVAVEL